MGQKVNPIGLRVGINRTWDSRWYADADYSRLLFEDLSIRKYLFDKLGQAEAGQEAAAETTPSAPMRSAMGSRRPTASARSTARTIRLGRRPACS